MRRRIKDHSPGRGGHGRWTKGIQLIYVSGLIVLVNRMGRLVWKLWFACSVCVRKYVHELIPWIIHFISLSPARGGRVGMRGRPMASVCSPPDVRGGTFSKHLQLTLLRLPHLGHSFPARQPPCFFALTAIPVRSHWVRDDACPTHTQTAYERFGTIRQARRGRKTTRTTRFGTVHMMIRSSRLHVPLRVQRA